ncbi:MAG: hypothetical protein ACM3ZU_08095 [Bacteroidota bacterium]
MDKTVADRTIDHDLWCRARQALDRPRGRSLNMVTTSEKKKELREMRRKETLGVILAVLETHRRQQDSGRITVDVRSGKAIWVKPVVGKVERPKATPDEARVLQDVDRSLREFQARGASGAVTLVVCEGRGVEVEKVVDLEKVRVG